MRPQCSSRSREHELEALESALACARSGAGRVVVVEAPAGCGKTALLAAALRHAAGFRALMGRGGEFERAAGFGVVRDLYGAALAADSPAQALEGAARLA
ncbi:MAG: AAA family ATPase, partial [Solirubrobacteraceae bacterium]